MHNIKVGLKHCSIFKSGRANVGPPSLFGHGATDPKNSQDIEFSRFTYMGLIPYMSNAVGPTLGHPLCLTVTVPLIGNVGQPAECYLGCL